MLELDYTNQFKKDLKLSKKRGKDLGKLEKIVELLLKEQPLLENRLSNNFSVKFEILYSLKSIFVFFNIFYYIVIYLFPETHSS